MNRKANAWIVAGITLAVILLVAIIFFGYFIGAYNSLVAKDANVAKLWGNVESAYQRRIDLIPNLVETVKGAAAFESSTYTAVTEARTKYMAAQTISDKQIAQGELDSALSRLLVTVEAYPQLKANQNFLALQDELAGTENRIKWERDKYNEGVQDYQTTARSFPTSVIAGMFNFDANKWQTFKSKPGADIAPQVKF